MSSSSTEAGPPIESMVVHEDTAVERYGLYTQGLGEVLKEAFPVAHVRYYFSLHQRPVHCVRGTMVVAGNTESLLN